jgi:hypothetical protein
MTNGEKFKQIFPNYQIDMGELYVYVWLPNHDAVDIPHEWWDAEYREPIKPKGHWTEEFNDLDLISREQAKTAIRDKFKDLSSRVEINTILNELPSVTPQEPQSFEWCDTCKEYDQENHCCHRWSKVIRNTVEEMKQGYEREVLDKIKAEIKHFMYDINPSSSESDYACNYILQIIDKYKAESEK